jgi:outer membrane protein assembly factor BamA
MGGAQYNRAGQRLSRGIKLLLVLVLYLHGQFGAFAAQDTAVIDVIRFRGNDVTREFILRQEMVVTEGSPLDLARIEKSRQAIMNLGLFKTVKAEVLKEKGANVLLITVDERFFILPLPLLDARIEEEEYSYGMELRFDNLVGLNQRLKLTYENKQSVDSDIPVRKESAFNYFYPRLDGSIYNLGLNGKAIGEDAKEVANGVVTGSHHFDSYSIDYRVSRWLNFEGVSEGWLLGGGMGLIQHRFSRKSGTSEANENSHALEFIVGLDYSAIKEFPFHREGSAYGYGLTLATPVIGSDYGYNRHRIYHRNYLALKQVDANLNTQFLFGLADGSSFGKPAFGVGGGGSLRGYESDFATGNAMLQLNTEYHHHFTGYRQLRGVVFVDLGNAWPGVMDVEIGRLLSSVGIGMRWRVQSFVDLTLRLDAAYALDTEATKVYATTSTSF